MLVAYEEPRFPHPYPVGIVVSQWKDDREMGMYVVYPIKASGSNYVEVEIATDSGHLTVVKPPLGTWQSLEDSPEGESEGYPSDDETEQDLYDVWDDGAAKHPEAAKRLYARYEPLIDTYAKDAIQFMNKHAAQEYDKKVQEAKANGWDVSLVQAPSEARFPYAPIM